MNIDTSKATESRWAKAMNALSLETWGKINTKAHLTETQWLGSQNPSTLSGSASAPVLESGPKGTTKTKEAPFNGQKLSEDQQENSVPYCSSSSDEDDKVDVPLEGLRPRPITEGEKAERYLLFKEQLERWAESKLA